MIALLKAVVLICRQANYTDKEIAAELARAAQEVAAGRMW